MIEDLRSQHLTRERARKALTARSPHPTSTRAAHVGWSGARPVYAHNPAYRFEAHPIATWAHCHACCRCRKVKGSGRGGKDFICARNRRANLAVPYRFPRYTPRLLLLKTAPLYQSGPGPQLAGPPHAYTQDVRAALHKRKCDERRIGVVRFELAAARTCETNPVRIPTSTCTVSVNRGPRS